MLFQLLISALTQIEIFSYDINSDADYTIDAFNIHVDDLFNDDSAVVNKYAMLMRFAAIAEYNPKYAKLSTELAIYEAVDNAENLFLPIVASGVLKNKEMEDPVLARSTMSQVVNTFAIVSPIVHYNFEVDADNALLIVIRIAKQLKQLNSLGYYCYKLDMKNLVFYDNQVYLSDFGSCTQHQRSESYIDQLPFLFQTDSEYMTSLPYNLRSHIAIISQMTPSDFLVIVKPNSNDKKQ